MEWGQWVNNKKEHKTEHRDDADTVEVWKKVDPQNHTLSGKRKQWWPVVKWKQTVYSIDKVKMGCIKTGKVEYIDN